MWTFHLVAILSFHSFSLLKCWVSYWEQYLSYILKFCLSLNWVILLEIFRYSALSDSLRPIWTWLLRLRMNLIIVFCAICFVFKIPVDAWNISLYLYKNLKREWAFFQYIFWRHSLVIGYPLFLGQDILPHWHCSFLCFNTLLQMNRHPWVFSLYQKSLHRFCLDVMRVCNQWASVGMIQKCC